MTQIREVDADHPAPELLLWVKSSRAGNIIVTAQVAQIADGASLRCREVRVLPIAVIRAPEDLCTVDRGTTPPGIQNFATNFRDSLSY